MPLPPGLDLTAYRLVQEGAHQHAQARARDPRRRARRLRRRLPPDLGARRRAWPGRARRARHRTAGDARAGLGVRRQLVDRRRATAAASSCAPSSRWRRLTSDRAIRVLVVDDQALVRAGFRMILEAEPDLVVAGEAADGTEARRADRRLSSGRRPHGRADARRRRDRGHQAHRRAADAAVKVIMLTTFDMDEYVYDALRAGASGFLLKDVPPEQLVDGIRAVHSGEVPALALHHAPDDRDPSRSVRRPASARRWTRSPRVSGRSSSAGARAVQRGDRRRPRGRARRRSRRTWAGCS